MRVAGAESPHADLVAAHAQPRLAFEHAGERRVAEAVQVVAPDDDAADRIVAALLDGTGPLDFNALDLDRAIALLGMNGAVYCDYRKAEYCLI
ncbi:hypothetical protein ASC93_03515 [Massilia sp. Root335]|nr:hypothetical protein ASC93_03515 [Massilia sp. Root335]